jgi:hypothetical protein
MTIRRNALGHLWRRGAKAGVVGFTPVLLPSDIGSAAHV